MTVKVRVSDYDITRGIPRTNLMPFPNPIATDTGSTWNPVVYSSAVVQPSTSTIVDGRRGAGSTAIRIVNTNDVLATGQVSFVPPVFVPAIPNQEYRISVWVNPSVPIQFSAGMGTYDRQYQSVGAWGDSYPDIIPAGEWTRITNQYAFTTPNTPEVAFISMGIGFYSASSTIPAGSVFLATDLMIEMGSPLNDYFDGSFATVGRTVYEWVDVPWRSASTETTSVPSSVLVFPPDQITGYSVVEDATPMDPNSFAGGYGQITFGLVEGRDTRMLKGKTFDLSDTVKGKVSGIVTGISGSDQIVNTTTDSALGVLNSWHAVPPQTGTFAELVNTWFLLVGLRQPVRFEGDIGSRTISAQGRVGNLWDYMKQFLSANKIEMSLVYNTVVFREFRQFEAYTGRATGEGWNISQGETARMVEVTYWNNTYTAGELYPAPNLEDEPTILQADANETVTYNLQLSSTPTLLSNPVAQDFVTDGPQSMSVYAVVGSDELPITAAQWNANGGNVTVAVSEEDPTQMEVTVVGADIENLAPFRIAMSSGSSTYYNALHIHGTGTSFVRESVFVPTGGAIDTTGTDIGVTVENRFVSTKEQAYDLARHTAAAYSGFDVTITGTALDINRRGNSGGVVARISDFNATWPVGDETIADFNARYANMTIAGFNALWDDTIQSQFPVQAFGNAAGARVLRDGEAYYRIDSATFNEVDMTYSASMDTTIADFNAVWSGATIADFNDVHYQKFVRDFSVVPLRRD